MEVDLFDNRATLQGSNTINCAREMSFVSDLARLTHQLLLGQSSKLPEHGVAIKKMKNTFIVSAGKLSFVSVRQIDTIYTIRKMISF
jgi:hypothetical protein